MRTTIVPYQTPAEVDDGRQPRENAVLCPMHRVPTWRRDGRCAFCISEVP